MSCKFLDLTGQKFGRLLVVDRGPDVKTKRYWNCLCDCGVRKLVSAQSLRAGTSKSCGCGRRHPNSGNTEAALIGAQVCSTCGKVLPLDRFYRRTSAWNGRSSRCKDCARAGSLARRYGITADFCEEMLEAQDGCCAICCSPNGVKRLVVDHDHSTGAVRGLLCGRCNTALGMLGDSAVTAMRAAHYLQGHAACKVASV